MTSEMSVVSFVPKIFAPPSYVPEPKKALYGGYEPDFLFRSGSLLVAVEVKDTVKAAMDAIARAYNLVRLPEVNQSIVIVPRKAAETELVAFAARTGIGLVSIDAMTGNVTWHNHAQQFNPSFTSAYSYVQEIKPGQEFAITVTVYNQGEKLLAMITVSYLPSYPFEVPQRKDNFMQTEEIKKSTNFAFSLSVKARGDAVKGIYPLMIKTEGLGLLPSYGSLEIRVE